MRLRYGLIISVLVLAITGFSVSLSSAQSQLSRGDEVASTEAIVFQNVRIFNGKSPVLSVPSNVLVVDNKIETISTAAVAPPSGV